MECLINVCTPPFSVPKAMVGNLVNFIKFSKRVEVEDFLVKQVEGFPFGKKNVLCTLGFFMNFTYFRFTTTANKIQTQIKASCKQRSVQKYK